MRAVKCGVHVQISSNLFRWNIEMASSVLLYCGYLEYFEYLYLGASKVSCFSRNRLSPLGACNSAPSYLKWTPSMAFNNCSAVSSVKLAFGQHIPNGLLHYNRFLQFNTTDIDISQVHINMDIQVQNVLDFFALRWSRYCFMAWLSFCQKESSWR